MKNMTEGSPTRLLVSFCIPILLGNLFQLTYSIADTRIVGSFLGDAALAAVGATTVLSNLYTGFFMGIANGFAIITARHFGAGNMRKLRIAFAAALLMGVLLELALVGLTLLTLQPILHFLNVPEELLPVSGGYIKIILSGMLVTMLYDILLTSARAIGDSVTPLLIMIISVVLNIFGDVLLLGLCRTGVGGAAAATVGAQLIALLVCALYLLKKYRVFRIKSGDFREITPDMIFTMLTTGISMGLMSSLISMGSLILQTAINGLGNSYIVAQSAARRITDVLMSVFVAFGHTMATFTSQNYGAGKYDRIRQGMNVGYLVTCSWCVVVLLIVYPFSPMLVQLITGSQDQVMIAAAARYLRVDSLLYFLVAMIFIERHSLQGVGDRITPLISSGIEMLGKILLTCTLVPVMGYAGVILVEPIVWIAMIIPLIIKVRKWKKSYSLM